MGLPVRPAHRLRPVGGRAVKRLRVAILTHSTNPRGGVVHGLELGDALCRLGHQVVVHAPDATGAGFFRDTLCGTTGVPVSSDRARHDPSR